jgi:hypothetical protein
LVVTSAEGGFAIVAAWQLRRWLVSFRSGAAWYAVGEYVARDGAGAIARAVEIFGPAEGHRAEKVPWDAAPLPRLNSRAGRSRS